MLVSSQPVSQGKKREKFQVLSSQSHNCYNAKKKKKTHIANRHLSQEIFLASTIN